MSEDRLNRMEEILQATLSLTQQCREDIVQLTQAGKTSTVNINRLSERLEQFIIQAEADRELIRSEITGIRTEVTRIVEYLFAQNNSFRRNYEY